MPHVDSLSDRTRSTGADPGRVIRVLLVDDNAMFGSGLGTLLDLEPGIAVIAHAADGDEAVRLAADLSPDVVVVDLWLPRTSGAEVIRRLRASGPDAPAVVAISAHAGVAAIAEAVAAGACAFVSKLVMTEEIVSAIRRSVADPACAGRGRAG